jgi:hypothetical protein
MEQVLPGEGRFGINGRGQVAGKGKRMNMVQVHTYVNEKLYLLKLFQESGEGGIKEKAGSNSSMMYLIHCKNLCKCHNVPHPSTTIKGKNV